MSHVANVPPGQKIRKTPLLASIRHRLRLYVYVQVYKIYIYTHIIFMSLGVTETNLFNYALTS